MGLTEQQLRWNESIEKAWKNKDKVEIDNPNSKMIELYEELKNKVFQSTQGDIEIIEKKNYLSFKIKKNHQNFVDIQVQLSAIKCVINLKKGKIKDTKKVLRDISKIGHFGCGDYEATIRSSQDITSYMPCILESYKVNS